MTRILIVEDEESLSDPLAYLLGKEGFEVQVVDNGLDAVTEFDRAGADLMLLDLMLPGQSGTEVCRQVRQRSSVPIIMLTAKDAEIDKVVGLELGADDYITKPFNPRELVARVRAVLRRAAERAPEAPAAPAAATLEIDGLRIEVGGREVYADGEGVALTPKEFDLLVTLIENRGLVLTREQLLERVWGFTFLGDSRTIDVHVRQLRRKLGAHCPIQTVWGTGYKVPVAR